MTTTWIDEAEQRAEAASPSPWETAMSNPKWTREQMLAYVQDHFSRGDGNVVHSVWLPDHKDTRIGVDRKNPDHAITAATTGNGPTSPQNAEFIAAARTDVPRLCKALKILLEHNTCDCGASDGWKSGNVPHTDDCLKIITERIRNGDF